MKKIELNKFQDFIDSSYLKEGIETNQEYWNQHFNDMASSTKEASSKTGESSTIPSWAQTGLKLDALKGKSADQRWDWITNRINTSIKDKQASKIESIKSEAADFPGYRILWKEEKTETGDQTDKSGKIYKVYFTDVYKGNPGIYIDRKEVNGKPGEELGRGYWGQKSRVQKVPGSTAAPTAADAGILWVDQPEEGPGATSSATLLDLFAATDIGREVMGWLFGDEAFKKFKETGEVTVTDSPPTSKEMNTSLTPEQKQSQKNNAQKMAEAGQKVEEPIYNDITSGEYSYNPDSFKITWDQMYEALVKAGADKNMDFKKTNLVGVRNTMYTKNKFSNRFTDLIAVMGPKKEKTIKIYPATTTPGPAFMYLPFRNWWVSAGLQETLNPKGVAILQPGVYEYQIGDYKDKYDALLQKGNVKVGRVAPVSSLREISYKTFSPTPIETVDKGIDIIKAETNTPSIDSYSAGSQVFKKSDDFNEMMKTVSRSGQGSVKYALIDSSNLG